MPAGTLCDLYDYTSEVPKLWSQSCLNTVLALLVIVFMGKTENDCFI